MQRRQARDHIEKPEDKIWKQWFDKLTPKDHENYLAKLGLTDEDKEELPIIEEQLHSIEGKESGNAMASGSEAKASAKGKAVKKRK